MNHMGQFVLDDIEIGVFFSIEILSAEGHAAHGRVKSAHGMAIALTKRGMAIEGDPAENRCSQK